MAIALGIALAVATLIVRVSLERSVDDYARSFAGPTPLRVVGPKLGGLSETVLPDVEAMPGVASAIPMVQAVALADGAGAKDVPVVAVGVDCSIQAVVGDFDCSPEALAALRTEDRPPPILPPGLAELLGPDGFVRTNLGPVGVGGAVQVEELEGVNEGAVVAFPLHVAQDLFTRPGTFDVIYVLPEEGTDLASLRVSLEEAVGEHNAVLGTEDKPPLVQLFSQLLDLFGVVAMFALATGAVLVHNAMSLSFQERRRDYAVAGALGGTRRTILGGALLEGGLIGLVGGVLGSFMGILAAYPVAGSVQEFTQRAGAMPVTVHITPLPFVIGAALGAAVGVIASLRSARRASRVDVVSELRIGLGTEAERDARKRPWGAALIVVGIAALALARVGGRDGGLEPWQPPVAQVGLLVAIVSFGVASVQLAPFVFAGVSRLVKGRRPMVRLGLAGLAHGGSRSSSMVLAAGAAVALAVMIASASHTISASIIESGGVRSTHEVVAFTTPGFTNTVNLEVGPSPQLVDALRAMPEVDEVHRMIGFTVGARAGSTIGVETGDGKTLPYQLIRGTADPEAFERGEVLIGPALARREGVRPGDDLVVAGRDGMASLRVQGIWLNGDFAGLEVSMPLWLAEEVWGPQSIGTLSVAPAPGVSADRLVQAIEEAGLDPNLTALPADVAVDLGVQEVASLFVDPFWAFQRVMMVVAFAAVLSNLLLAAMSRRRELGLVAAVGMTPRGLAGLVVVEAVAVAGAALVFGTILGAAVYDGFLNVIGIIFPYPMPYRLDAAAPFLYGGLMLVVLLAAALLPAWRTSRLRLVEALRYE